MSIKLSEFAQTERQREIMESVEEVGVAAAARQFNISCSTVSASIRRLKGYAAKQGWSPEHDLEHPVPSTHYLKGASTLYGEDGQKKLQWVKSTVDQDRLVDFSRELADSIVSNVKPLKRIKAPSGRLDKTRTAVYPIGDAHIGLLCWEGDAQQNWDSKIASEVMREVYSSLFSCTTDCETATIINLGDWFHTDNSENRTAKSGHALDVDTRWSKILSLGVNLMRQVIDEAARKHKRVHVINEIGNHDDQSSIMLSICLAGIYENNKRITIDTSPAEFHFQEFGQNLFGVNHGHKCKPATLYQVMTEYEGGKPWARCKHRHWFTGHIHHHKSQDVGTQTIEAFRTLIPRDNYAQSHGYRGKRNACSITFHKDRGECARAVESVES